MQYQSPLAQAIHLLQSGKRISRSLAATLIEEGYDIASLINRYSTK